MFKAATDLGGQVVGNIDIRFGKSCLKMIFNPVYRTSHVAVGKIILIGEIHILPTEADSTQAIQSPFKYSLYLRKVSQCFYVERFSIIRTIRNFGWRIIWLLQFKINFVCIGAPGGAQRETP